MKFDHLVEYNVRNIVFEKSCRKCDRETGSNLFLFFEKALIHFGCPRLGHSIKTNCRKFQTVVWWPRNVIGKTANNQKHKLEES